MDERITAFHEGREYLSYEIFAPSRQYVDGEEYWTLRVWAPRAESVSVVGDFNAWDALSDVMQARDGIWEITVKAHEYDAYKFAITHHGNTVLKCDPYALHAETTPANASKLYDVSRITWSDSEWMASRTDCSDAPMNIYEVHVGSWRRHSDGNPYSYRHFADEIVPYVKQLNYTHIELLPVTEYPYDGSWGYQVTGMFAVTSRYGTPEDFCYLVDKCHRAGIGVILDWVSAHFPRDEHGLRLFDGEPLYEYADPLKAEHKEWGTLVYDYSKPEVKSFLISSAMMFAKNYHVDGIRMDAVASMLYLDYNRTEWRPNIAGGNYNLEAIDFIRELNTALLSENKGFVTIAEESTAFPLVTAPPYDGGLGFNYKWNMGWMNDNLSYLSLDPFFRKDHHDKMTFSMTYAFSENYILPLSHDEVVHGKRSILGRVPGEYDDKFDGYKTFLGFMIGHPGKKLTFMGGEFAQFIEWDYQKGLDWLLLDFEKHARFRRFVRDLNALYLSSPALWQDKGWEHFRWLVVDDRSQNVFAHMRESDGDVLITVANFSPVERRGYLIGVPKGDYKIVLSSADKRYGGAKTLRKPVRTVSTPMHGYDQSIKLDLVGNSVIFIKMIGGKQ